MTLEIKSIQIHYEKSVFYGEIRRFHGEFAMELVFFFFFFF
jgi:hypothetical protein